MAEALRSTGRVEDVKILRTHHYRKTTATLKYGFRDRGGRQHQAWVYLQFGGDGKLGDDEIDYGYYLSDLSSSTANPVRGDVIEIWRTKCRVGVFVTLS